MKPMILVLLLAFTCQASSSERDQFLTEAARLLGNVCKKCELSKSSPTFSIERPALGGPRDHVSSTCTRSSTQQVFGQKVADGICISFDEKGNATRVKFLAPRKVSGYEVFELPVVKNKLVLPKLPESAKGFFQASDFQAKKVDVTGRITEWRSSKVVMKCDMEFPIGTVFKVDDEDQIDFWVSREISRNGRLIAPDNPIPLGSAGKCSKLLDELPGEGYFQ